MPIPRDLGRWVRRDDVVAYLERYAERFTTECTFSAGGVLAPGLHTVGLKVLLSGLLREIAKDARAVARQAVRDRASMA